MVLLQISELLTFYALQKVCQSDLSWNAGSSLELYQVHNLPIVNSSAILVQHII